MDLRLRLLLEVRFQNGIVANSIFNLPADEEVDQSRRFNQVNALDVRNLAPEELLEW